MHIKKEWFSEPSLKNNENKLCRKYYALAGLPVIANNQIVSTFRTFMYSKGTFLIIISAVITFLLNLIKNYGSDKEAQIAELESSEINEMLRYRYRSRVIVPIESINEEGVLALEYGNTLSKDITAFSVWNDVRTCEKIKEDFQLLDTDITLVTKYSASPNITEQVLEFIKSTEYNCTSRDIVTVILPQFVSRKSWGNLSENRAKSYIENDLSVYINVVVMTVS